MADAFLKFWKNPKNKIIFNFDQETAYIIFEEIWNMKEVG